MGAMERLHYRAAFASDDDHDRALQDVLRFELMEGRVQMEAYLERIATALETQATLQESLACICELASKLSIGSVTDSFNTVYLADQIADGRPVTIPVEFVAGVGDPPEGYADWAEYDAERCDLAQAYHLAVLTAWEDGVNKALGAITITTAALDAVLISCFGVGIPLVGAIDSIVAMLAYGPLSNTELNNLDVITTMKQELVCPLYNADTAADAVAECQTAITAQAGNLSLPCFGWLQVMYSGMMLERVFNRTATLTYRGSIETGYCSICEPVIPGEWEFLWPPCDNGHFLDGGICYDGKLSFNANVTMATEEIEFHDPGTGFHWETLDVELEWYSRHPNGWQVGVIELHRWDGSEWDVLQGIGYANNADAGNLCTKLSAFDQGLPWLPGDYRLVVKGQPGQTDVDPYPLMLTKISAALVSAAD